jgi:hypothetical protein
MWCIYCSIYFCFLRNIFIFCTTGGSKHAPEGNREPSCKYTAIDAEVKIRIIHKYEGTRSSVVVMNYATSKKAMGSTANVVNEFF